MNVLATGLAGQGLKNMSSDTTDSYRCSCGYACDSMEMMAEHKKMHQSEKKGIFNRMNIFGARF